MWRTVILVLCIFIILNIVLDQRAKLIYKEEYFPPGIVFPLDESIELPDVADDFISSDSPAIPKTIYRCYSTKKAMKKFDEVFRLTDERMPGFKQVYYDDEMIEDFIKNNYSDRIFKAYKSINPEYGAARADLFRYLVIYLYGGIYMDIKSGPSHLIDDDLFDMKGKLIASKGVSGIPHFPKYHLKSYINFSDDWGFVTGVNFGSEWQQYTFASPKGNVILKKIIQQVVSNIEAGMKQKNVYRKGNISVVAMTGPITFSIIIEKYKHEYSDHLHLINKGSLGGRIDHSLIDYKSIMKDKHYSRLENKQILI